MAEASIVIHQLGLLFLIITLFSLGVKVLRQPIIIGYVASGLLFSFLFTEVAIKETILLFGELGILFLLFTLGIEFDLENLKLFGKEVLISTLIQSVVFLLIGFGVSQLFSLSILESIYVGVVFMFSSTLLVAKSLEDKQETQVLHGKLIISTLIIQDIIAIISITLLQVFNSDSISTALYFPLYGIILLSFAVIFSKFIISFIFMIAHKYSELLLIASIGVCFLFAQVASMLQYSPSIGAFIGGLIIGNTIYRQDMITKLSTLVIFFNMLFFVGLGFQIDLDISSQYIYLILVLTLLSLVLKPIIFYLTLRLVGFNYKTSLVSGLYLGQASEFGIIILLSLDNQISNSILGVIIIIVILSLILSSYTIKYSQRMSKKLLPILQPIDKFFFEKSYKDIDKSTNASVIFFGYSKENYFIKHSSFDSKKIFVVESNPSMVKELQRLKIRHVFCSTYLSDFLHHISFKNPKFAISNMSELSENIVILNAIKSINSHAITILYAKNMRSAKRLYDLGADYVICFEVLKSEYLEHLFDEFLQDENYIRKQREKSIETINSKLKN